MHEYTHTKSSGDAELMNALVQDFHTKGEEAVARNKAV